MLSLDTSGYGRIVDTLGPIPQITRKCYVYSMAERPRRDKRHRTLPGVGLLARSDRQNPRSAAEQNYVVFVSGPKQDKPALDSILSCFGVFDSILSAW